MLLNDALKLNSSIRNFVDIVSQNAYCQPDHRVYLFLADGETESDQLTYQSLDQAARAIAAQLQQTVSAGDRALLLYPPGLDFITAFLGCLYAQVIAVPTYLPRQKSGVVRLEAIAANAQPTIALTTTALQDSVIQQFAAASALQSLPVLATDAIPATLSDRWQTPSIEPDTIAFLQYTSGSTGTPKGVMVSHGNLLHNSELIQRRFKTTSDTVGVSWLPPYHDMGLIGSILHPLYTGSFTVLMSPIAFLQKPDRWLQAISRYRGQVSGGPNFAFDLCVQKIPPERLQDIDLSGWEVAYNGAEPIRAATLERFAAHFAPYGFRREAFYPCYGMAEATLMIAGGLKAEPPTVYRVDRAALEQHQVVFVDESRSAHQAAQHTATLVAHGQTDVGQTLAIVNPQTLAPCKANEVGEIWVRGGSVAQGYWQREDETQATFQACLSDVGLSDVCLSDGDLSDTEAGLFLRTGDLGFLHEGNLCITGRLKDLIIVRGRNYYPQDIELTVQTSHPALRPDCGAVFTVEQDHQTRLVVVQEVERTALRTIDTAEVIRTIRAAVSQEYELAVDAVWLLKPATIPKTSSNKISRTACRRVFETRSMEGIALDVLPVLPDSSSEPTPSTIPLTADALLSIPPDDRQVYLETYIQAKLAAGLRIDPSQLSPQQPLHEMGLNSLVTIEIKHQIETDLGIDVPVVQFLEGVTIHRLASKILHQMTGNTCGQTSQRLPFFCVHPVMGVASVYYHLAERLGADQPFYGLQSAGITGEGEPCDRLEDIAAEYIQAIQKIQPEGPYCLGGWSFGSLVAFEMAQQLQQAGHSILFLAVIDTPPTSPTRLQNRLHLAKFLVNSVLRYLWPYLGATVDYFLAAVEEQQLFQRSQHSSDRSHTLIESANLAQVSVRQDRVFKLFQPAARRLFKVIQANNRALLNYTPQPYPGKITLFRTHQMSGRRNEDPTLGWGALAQGGVEQYLIPGNHLNVVLPPQVDVLAEQLTACLDRAQNQSCS